jgi:predicted component of type VI protein secretion system
MGVLGPLAPEAPPIPVRAPAPVAEIQRQIEQASTVAKGKTIYCGDVTFAWLDRFAAWFRRS